MLADRAQLGPRAKQRELLFGQRQMLRFGALQVSHVAHQIVADGAQLAQLSQFGLGAQRRERGRRRDLQVRGASIDVLLKQAQRRLALRDPIGQGREVQARGIGIEFEPVATPRP